MRFKVQAPIRLIQKPAEIPETGVRIVVLAETRTGGLTGGVRHLKTGIAYGEVPAHVVHEDRLIKALGFSAGVQELGNHRHGWVVVHAIQYPDRLLIRPVPGQDMNHIDGRIHDRTAIKLALLRKMLNEEIGIPLQEIPAIHLSTLNQDDVELRDEHAETIDRLRKHSYSTLMKRFIQSD